MKPGYWMYSARKTKHSGDGPSWRFRRKLMVTTLLFSMGAIVAVMALRWDDTRLAETVIVSAFGVIGIVLSAYIGGAAWEDVRLRTDRPPERRQEPFTDEYV